jgi:hypothetical protein
MRFSAHRVLLGLLLLAPAAAFAQAPAGTAPPAPTPAQGQGGGATGGGSAEPAKPKGNTEGFTFTDKPAPRPAGPVVRVVRRAGPIATLPGFEETSDGGSRLFVALTQSVQVEERKAQGVITYVLKGAHINRYNNTNALVTVHFNTPVSRARLVPAGNDLHFIVELRAAATPTFKMVDNADRSAMLTIDFAKGDFTNAPAQGDAPPVVSQQPKKLGKKTPPQPGQQPAQPATTPVQPAPAPQQPANTGPTP